jgi:DNA-binding phage protein
MSSQKLKTRNKILNATWQLMEESSHKITRMSDIAKEAGISRQALYLHFDSRVDLMIATVNYVDEVKGLAQRLEQFKTAKTGKDMLDALVDVWGNYMPEIYPIAKAMLSTKDNDVATKTAWMGCMSGLRSYCLQTIGVLKKEGILSNSWNKKEAVELLWTLISIHNWQQLTQDCGWSNRKYVKKMKVLVNTSLISE